jgi:hypothetical protein
MESYLRMMYLLKFAKGCGNLSLFTLDHMKLSQFLTHLTGILSREEVYCRKPICGWPYANHRELTADVPIFPFFLSHLLLQTKTPSTKVVHNRNKTKKTASKNLNRNLIYGFSGFSVRFKLAK